MFAFRVSFEKKNGKGFFEFGKSLNDFIMPVQLNRSEPLLQVSQPVTAEQLSGNDYDIQRIDEIMLPLTEYKTPVIPTNRSVSANRVSKVSTTFDQSTVINNAYTPNTQDDIRYYQTNGNMINNFNTTNAFKKKLSVRPQ